MVQIVLDTEGRPHFLRRMWRAGNTWVLTIPAPLAEVIQEDERGQKWVEWEERDGWYSFRPFIRNLEQDNAPRT